MPARLIRRCWFPVSSCGDRARMFFSQLTMAGDGTPALRQPRRVPRNTRRSLPWRQATLVRLEAELEQLRGVDEAPGLRKRVTKPADRTGISARIHLGQHGLLAGETSFRGMHKASRTTFLQATPIDVSGLLDSELFQRFPTVCADLGPPWTVQGNFEHIRGRLGLADGRELVVPSHFKYEKQALL